MADYPAGPDYSNPLLGIMSGLSGLAQGYQQGRMSAAQLQFQRMLQASEMQKNAAMAGYYQARPGLMQQNYTDQALRGIGYDPQSGQRLQPLGTDPDGNPLYGGTAGAAMGRAGAQQAGATGYTDPATGQWVPGRNGVSQGNNQDNNFTRFLQEQPALYDLASKNPALIPMMRKQAVDRYGFDPFPDGTAAPSASAQAGIGAKGAAAGKAGADALTKVYGQAGLLPQSEQPGFIRGVNAAGHYDLPVPGDVAGYLSQPQAGPPPQGQPSLPPVRTPVPVPFYRPDASQQSRVDLQGAQKALDAARLPLVKSETDLNTVTARYLGPKTAAQIAADNARAGLDTTTAGLAPALAHSLIGLRGAQGAAAGANAATGALNARNRPGVVNGAAPGAGKSLLPNGLTPTQDQALAKEDSGLQTRRTGLVASYNGGKVTDPNTRAEVNRQIRQIDARRAQIKATRSQLAPVNPAGQGYRVVPLPGLGAVRVPNAPPLPGGGQAGPTPGPAPVGLLSPQQRAKMSNRQFAAYFAKRLAAKLGGGGR